MQLHQMPIDQVRPYPDNPRYHPPTAIDALKASISEFGFINPIIVDADVCNELGLEPDELIRLKHITGFSALFKQARYSKAWETDTMIRERRRHGVKTF